VLGVISWLESGYRLEGVDVSYGEKKNFSKIIEGEADPENRASG
jgi:hypothetical protein